MTEYLKSVELIIDALAPFLTGQTLPFLTLAVLLGWAIYWLGRRSG